MKQVYSRSCLSLGLLLMLTACGDPTQFNELTIGEPVFENENPEMSTLPEIDKKTNKTGAGYSGEEKILEDEENKLSTKDLAPEAERSTAPQTTANAPDNKLFTDCEASPGKSIVAHLYQLPEDTKKLPDFATLSSLRTVCLSQLNIKDRQFSEGFPGVEGLFEWFALDMQFHVTVPKNGIYEFSLASDDGAILWIDDAEVINNDGLHAVQEKTGKIYLNAGQHKFRVAYYQGPRWRIALELFWKIPGTSSRSYIPSSALSRAQ